MRLRALAARAAIAIGVLAAVAGCARFQNADPVVTAVTVSATSGSPTAPGTALGTGPATSTGPTDAAPAAGLVRHGIPGTHLVIGLPGDFRVAAAATLGSALPAVVADEPGFQALYARAPLDVRLGLRLVASDATGSALLLYVVSYPVPSTTQQTRNTILGAAVSASGARVVPGSAATAPIGETELSLVETRGAGGVWTELVVVPDGGRTDLVTMIGPAGDFTSSGALRTGIVAALDLASR